MSKVLFGRSVHFTASHYYRVEAWDEATNLQTFGDAATPHEHHWVVTCWFGGERDEHGMIVDLGHVDSVLNREVVNRFDGQIINHAHPHFQKHQPTTEELAALLGEQLSSFFDPGCLTRVRVAESDDIFAEWCL